MKLSQFMLVLSLLFSVCMNNNAEQLIFPLLTLESQTNVAVTADMNHPKVCPLEFTNLLSNTNLLSIAEQRLFLEIAKKYKNVTTNSGPVGAAFKGLSIRQRKFQKHSETFPVACFTYTNSADQEEIASFFGDKQYVIGRYRTTAGDGYDVIVFHGALVQYQGYKHGLLDGLCVQINNEDDKNRLVTWTRFSKGKAIGKFVMWGEDGQIIAEAEFKHPFDFLKYQTAKFDLAWTEAQSSTTNSVHSSK